mgnify:CR=1 FL=1
MIGTLLRRLCNAFALLGGIVMLALIAMSLVSLVGRKLFSAPILGDLEMLEMSVAVAVSLFLPLCELRDNHIRVDLLEVLLPGFINRLLLTIGHLLLAAVALFICWRGTLLAIGSYNYTDTSTMLAIPLWIPQGLMIPGFALLAACAVYRAWLAWTTGAHGSALAEAEEAASASSGARRG